MERSCDAYVLKAHGLQEASVLAPVSLLALPDAHAIHEEEEFEPLMVLYVPPSHAVHAVLLLAEE